MDSEAEVHPCSWLLFLVFTHLVCCVCARVCGSGGACMCVLDDGGLLGHHLLIKSEVLEDTLPNADQWGQDPWTLPGLHRPHVHLWSSIILAQSHLDDVTFSSDIKHIKCSIFLSSSDQKAENWVFAGNCFNYVCITSQQSICYIFLCLHRSYWLYYFFCRRLWQWTWVLIKASDYTGN